MHPAVLPGRGADSVPKLYQGCCARHTPGPGFPAGSGYSAKPHCWRAQSRQSETLVLSGTMRSPPGPSSWLVASPLAWQQGFQGERSQARCMGAAAQFSPWLPAWGSLPHTDRREQPTGLT